MKHRKNVIKIVIFFGIAVVLFGGVSYVVRPVWTEWNNYNTTHGFYEEPENTIETLFLGASTNINGIIPMELYEEYGICAYNVCTTSQSMLSSYYWLQEVYRLHSETLDTVVLDTSMLRRNSGRSNQHKALDAMHFSMVKYHAVRDGTSNFSDFLTFLIPVLSYHERWKDLTKEDFVKAGYEPAVYMRGYQFVTDQALDTAEDYTDLKQMPYIVDTEKEAELHAKELSYLEKMTEFCEEHAIRLVLIKTEMGGWTAEDHNATQAVADQYGLDFLDFNFYPYVDAVDYNYASDSMNSHHLNYYGATNLTHYIGNYLMETCGNRDVRGDETYAFLEDELTDYHRATCAVAWGEETDPAEYLSTVVSEEGVTVFIVVQDDAAKSLTEQQREGFASMGLTLLSGLEYRDSYLAVIEDGMVVSEQVQRDTDVVESGGEQDPLLYSGILSDKTEYTLISGGYNAGKESSILLDGEEYGKASRGLNIVVYDRQLRIVADSAVFDTNASAERSVVYYKEALENALSSGTEVADFSTKLRQFYLYDRMWENTKAILLLKQETGEGGLLDYLQAYWGDTEYSIYLSVQEDAASSLTDEMREALCEMGLVKLSELEEGDSYLAVIQNGTLQMEEIDHNGQPLKDSGNVYKVISGGGTSSIKIDGKEYAPRGSGLNIVIYDTVTDTVVDAAVY